VFTVVMIALSSILVGYESIRRLLHPEPVRYVGIVIAAGLIGFAGNELVAVYRIRIGRKIGSAALVADGMHARTDGFTSLAVVVGAIGVLVGYPLADPIVGLLITVTILFVLKGAATDIYRRLMDAVDPDLVDAAEGSLLATAGVVGYIVFIYMVDQLWSFYHTYTRFAVLQYAYDSSVAGLYLLGFYVVSTKLLRRFEFAPKPFYTCR